MTRYVLHVSEKASDELRVGIAKIQQELRVTVPFPDEVEEAAQRAAASPRLPDLDRTDLELVTLDPASSMDLDQAMHLARDGAGYLVHYAIADVAAFVEPGGPIDLEAHRRGETLYGADTKIALHPTVLSEGAASLLPDQVRPALVWTIALDAKGSVTAAKVERARVRSRAKLAYEVVQGAILTQDAHPMMAVLEEIGRLRLQQEADRGGVSLPMPEQEVDIDGDSWRLELRQQQPVETWNAQISLLTGICAASIMLRGKVGILRTLPAADDRAIERLRRTAKALGVPWPSGQAYPEFVRSLDPSLPNHAAMTVACTSLLRGAGYVTFDGPPPKDDVHAALATTYAHVTAPLRRLVDRYGQEICVALCAGEPVPQWVLDAMPGLPESMQDAGRRSSSYQHAVLDLVEAELLKDDIGQRFSGVVLESDRDEPNKGKIQIAEPAVEASLRSVEPLPVGDRVSVTLAEADPQSRVVRFTL